MKFLYEYRTSDNVRHSGVIAAPDREAAFAALKEKGIRPGSVIEAPGLFNKIFGKGKRWMAIGVLCVLCLVLCAVIFTQDTGHPAQGISFDATLDSPVRRQVIGDVAIIEKGISTGWADVFELEGERFLAGFAVPGTSVAVRSTTEAEILKALDHDCRNAQGTSLEERQIRAMVEGMKEELRKFLANGGTVVQYGQRLVERQERELGYHNLAKRELEEAAKAGKPKAELDALWESRNAHLRKMGIKLIPMPEAK